MRQIRAWLWILVVALGCGNGGGGADAWPDAQTDADDTAADGPAPDGPAPDGPAPDGPMPDGPAPDGPAPDGPAPDGPAPYTRPAEGEPLSAAELAAATDRYIDLLDHLRYFAFLDERVHGWPRSDPAGRYWYGTWWSGVDVVKAGGEVTYLHGAGGADNNGLRTGPILEGVCFAEAVRHDPLTAGLVRRLVRGLTSWLLAMERESEPDEGPILARAAYPESVTSTDGGRTIRIDYDLNHPGEDNDATQYVRLPDNPWWGDLWVKNKRSKDDIGHMLRAVGQIDACAEGLDAETVSDLEALRERYAAWARRVEDDGWRIASRDRAGQLWYPSDLLAQFVALGDPPIECDAMLALRLAGERPPDGLDCEDGVGPADPLIIESNDHNGEILRSFHEAAALHARRGGREDVARPLLDGLVARMEEGLDGLLGEGEPTPYLEPEDLVDLLVHSANLGVPLTAREVRWIHERVAEADAAYRAPGNEPVLHVFDAATPDGAYAFQPSGSGVNFRSLGLLLGACASPWRSPTSEPLLDCDRVREGLP